MVQEVIPVGQILQVGEGSRSSSTPIGVTSTAVLRPNSHRKEATFTNNSANTIFLAKGQEASLNAGIRLNANGGSAVIKPDTTGRIYSGPITAISAFAAMSLCWTEDW